MSNQSRCPGCGVAFQHNDPNLMGYRQNDEQTYCQACYQLLHYGIVKSHLHPEDLPRLNPGGLMLMVSSVMHLDLLFHYPIHRYQPDATYVYVINQMDLLPKSTNLDYLMASIISKAKEMHIPYQDIIFMSAKRSDDISHLKSYVLHQKAKDIYLLGVQNSGKTTLFKALTDDTLALAFKKAGLTQQAISRPLGDHMVYDMPGLFQKGYLHELMPYETYKGLLPEAPMHAKIYPVKDGTTICVEGLFAITYRGEPSSLVFYLNRQIRYHKTHAKNIERLFADKAQHFKIYVDRYESKTFKAPFDKNQLTLADMGIMHVQGPCHVQVIYPKGAHISLTEALFQ